MTITNRHLVALLAVMAGLCLSTQATAALPLPGDYNEDGVVDAQDYTVWQAGFGTEFSIADYPIWRDNLGAVASNNTVPEPGMAVLAGIAILSLAGFARWRKQVADMRSLALMEPDWK